MKHRKVGSVMTSDVVRAGYGTPFKQVAQLLHQHRISGLPVVDTEGKVIGVLSETDLMARQAEADDPFTPPRRFRRLYLTASARLRRAKARARTAGQLMSEPAITVGADATIAQAARIMAEHRVERLPVVDEKNRLVGIVTRRDLLQIFLRTDHDIRSEILQEVLVRDLWLAPHMFDVRVDAGVVTLAGELERRSEVPVAVHLTRAVDGVVDVVDKLTYRFDDSRLPPTDQALHGIADDWLRKL
ncbi:CBS domain-containing protein [Streptomyces sp. N35]|uniref:CBS domain-containing protein n=1 Tax=Streptomyces sp. N35 TaxID=2795730 RepID=UPI0018F63007|nr:CBS domain-containing protein [Streptomyces sp. N35]